jgi:GT2 family glycosyltransferase
MTKKSDYEAAGGLDESFKVAFNDVDYCLKLREMGKLVVYNANARLYHYESKSRGADNTPEKLERFSGEIRKFEQKWPDILLNGDPYYNVNLTLTETDYGLKS